jgi:hypothetical protein
MNLSREELESLRIAAQKALALGDGTIKIDANDLAIMTDFILEAIELAKYENDLKADHPSLQTSFWGN